MAKALPEALQSPLVFGDPEQIAALRVLAQPPTYLVVLRGTARAEISVEAVSEAEAEEKADALATAGGIDWDVDFDDVVSARLAD